MRTLRRPMFRMGGSANEGITSGLDKPKRGLVDEPGKYSQTLEDQFGLSEIDKLVKSRRPKETYKDRDDFLINLGLDLVSRPPSGNIISTIGQSAKGPFKQFQTGQAQKRKTQAESESDLFNTLVGARAKVMGSESGGKTYAKLEIANNIERTIEEIADLEKQVKAGVKGAQIELDQKKARLEFLTKENAIGKSLMSNTEFAANVLKGIVNRLKTEVIDDPNNPGSKIPKYRGGNKDPELLAEARRQYYEFFKTMPEETEEKAEGGRIGYQQGMSVMPAAGDMGQATGNMQQETMPEEIQQDLTFEELRNRLPQEVGDDIINLILTSAEAMEDFATIQTEQDISIFNKKYGVNLVLPSEE
jgi:hypothetical protein